MRRHTLACSLAVLLLGGAGIAGAQTPATQTPTAVRTPEQEASDTLGWHIVRPGDTMEEITEHYLGTSILWRDNWRLNPQIRDPHMLRIGSRLRVIVHRELPPRTTEVLQVRRRVEQKPHPNPWMPAAAGDLLQEQDGVRTYRRSSTVLGFDDGTRLTVTEDSLVYMRVLRRSLQGVDQDEIEVVSGQADLEVRQTRSRAPDIEVVLGQVSAEPQPGASGLARSRLRRQESGDAQIMVYSGTTGVAAAGTRIEVPAGMGTSVPQSGPPAPPRKLLPAPKLLLPAAAVSIAFANPVLSWRAVEDAVAYTVEVCADAACEQLVDRAPALTATSWQSQGLPVGELFWRATAVDSSGLDGYPSRSRQVSISAATSDDEAPVVVAWIDGALTNDAETVATRPGAMVGLTVHDDLSGVASVEYRWDEDDWLVWTGRELQVPGAGGTHELQLRATDLAGHQSRVWSLRIAIDNDKPAPPQVRLPGMTH